MQKQYSDKFDKIWTFVCVFFKDIYTCILQRCSFLKHLVHLGPYVQKS